MTFAIIHFLLYIKYNGNIEKLEQKHIYSIPGFMWKGKGCVCVSVGDFLLLITIWL